MFPDQAVSHEQHVAFARGFGEVIHLPQLHSVDGHPDVQVIRRLATETMERMGDVHILVNNAGAAWGSPAEDHPVEAWDKVMNLNIRGYFILSQHVAKASMIPRKTGRIINIASIAGLGGNPPGMQTIAYNT